LLLPCENDQAKPDRFPRLACSTLLSKILERGPPKRFPCGSRLKLLRLSVPELVALVGFSGFPHPSTFLRDFLRLSKIWYHVNPPFLLHSGPVQRIVGGSSLLGEALMGRPIQVGFKPVSEKHRAAQNIKERPKLLEPLEARERLISRVVRWIVLCGIPYRGSGAF
jgi:hypothetical protein